MGKTGMDKEEGKEKGRHEMTGEEKEREETRSDGARGKGE